MLTQWWTKVEGAERKLRRSFGKDISTPSARRWSAFHYHFFDHAFLRTFWTNFFEIAPGVYRSNQPTHRRFERYAKMGIKSVINLRGEEKYSHYLFEKESVEALGMTLYNSKMWARKTASRDRILHTIELLRTVPKPLMFHCKSGADRAGFTAATYLLVFQGATVAEAKKMLSLKYIHLTFTKTGIQGYILDVYDARQKQTGLGFEDWIRTEYDHRIIQDAFDNRIPADQVVLPT